MTIAPVLIVISFFCSAISVVAIGAMIMALCTLPASAVPWASSPG